MLEVQRLALPVSIILPTTLVALNLFSTSAQAYPRTLIVEQTRDGLLNSPFPADSGNALNQITSVSDLRDVAPTDWAYEALRSLVERYGCIVGYPDRTFQGNRALSRWEFGQCPGIHGSRRDDPS